MSDAAGVMLTQQAPCGLATVLGTNGVAVAQQDTLSDSDEEWLQALHKKWPS